MGGVNLSEESRNILSGSSELIGTQVRSCRDEPFLDISVLNARIHRIGKLFEICFIDLFLWVICKCHFSDFDSLI